MAITLLELSKRLKDLQGYLAGPKHGEIMAKLGNEALVLVRDRVQETGVNAKGEKFPAYSTKPMLAGRKSFKTEEAFKKVAGSKKKRSELKWVTLGGADKGFESYLDVSSGKQGPSASGAKRLFELPGGYKQLRELHNRQGKFVDFVFTGRMWGNIKLVSNKSELQSGVAVIKATEPEQKKKLEGNTKRKGEILALSKSEESRLADLYEVWVGNGLRQVGLL